MKRWRSRHRSHLLSVLAAVILDQHSGGRGSTLFQTRSGTYPIAPTNGSNPTRRLARIVRVREAAAMRPEQRPRYLGGA